MLFSCTLNKWMIHELCEKGACFICLIMCIKIVAFLLRVTPGLKGAG